MLLEHVLENHPRILSEGSVYELLRRSPDVEFDPHIAHASLIYDPASAKVLESVIRQYFDLAVQRGLPVVTTTATWRSSRERLDRSAFKGLPVNQDNVRFDLDIRDSYGTDAPPILIGGGIGPKGDAYKPEEAPPREEAREFHRFQIEALAEAGPDFLQASTLPALEEAIGIAEAMSDTGLPYVISFVVERSGTLLDGTPLSVAIQTIDREVTKRQALYGVNCVHPTVLHAALAENSGIDGKIIEFAGNTSVRSVNELDGLEELDTEDPEIFAGAVRNLVSAYPIPIIGGCCGTSPAHMASIARTLQ